MKRTLERLAELIVERPRLVLGMLAVVALGFGLGLPWIRTDPSPQGMTHKIEDQERISRVFRERFGNTDHVVVLLIGAGDVLAPAPLRYIHEASRGVAALQNVERVDSVTVTPLALESTGAGLPSAPEGGAAAMAQMLAALQGLVEAAPERFPFGVMTVAERLGRTRFRPAVAGAAPTEAEAGTLRRALASAPLVKGQLVSEDLDLAAIAVLLDDEVEDPFVRAKAVAAIDAWLRAHPAPAGVSVDVGGLPHLYDSITQKMAQDQVFLVPMTLLVCIVLLQLSLRWRPGALLPIVAVGLTALIVVGAMAWLGEPLNVITNIIPPLLIIIGIADSVHLIGRYREELALGLPTREASRRAIVSMATACFFTSVTTALGLACLVVARTEMLQRFGVTAALGVMVAYVVTILFIPAAMSFFEAPPVPAEGPTGERTDALERLLVGGTAKILGAPGWTAFAALVFIAGCGLAAASSLRVDSALLDEFDPDDPVFRSTRIMESELQGVRPLELVLEGQAEGRLDDPKLLSLLDETKRWLLSQPGVLGVSSHADILHEAWAQVAGDPAARAEPLGSAIQVGALNTLLSLVEPDPLAAFVTPDRKAGRMQVRLADMGAQATTRLIAAIRARLTPRVAELGDLELDMTGEGYFGSVGITAVVRDLSSSLLTAVVFIFLILTVMFRSLRLGLLSIPPNVIPLVGTLAWMALRGIPLNAATVIVFSISFGLAVDGSIHVLARFREERAKGACLDLSLLRAARGTGRAIVVSCATLALGFGVFVFSGFVPVRNFGELIAVTALFCLISTLIVQPALLRLAGAGAGEREARGSAEQLIALALDRAGDQRS